MSKDSIAVVKVHYRLEEAYRQGYNEFEGFEFQDDDEPLDLSHFKSSARWVNNIAPELRAMAGYADSGPGTYTVEREVAAIKPGCEEDEPAEAELVECIHVHQRLVEAFDKGAYDAADGREQSPPEW
jgi:hypothetical protein